MKIRLPLGLLRFGSLLRKCFLCPLGFHGSRLCPDGAPANFCGHCGHTFNPNAFQPWVITTRTGERYEVRAINEHHARSLVIYGTGGPLQMDAQGKPLGAVKVHPENILTVVKPIG